MGRRDGGVMGGKEELSNKQINKNCDALDEYFHPNYSFGLGALIK